MVPWWIYINTTDIQEEWHLLDLLCGAIGGVSPQGRLRELRHPLYRTESGSNYTKMSPIDVQWWIYINSGDIQLIKWLLDLLS